MKEIKEIWKGFIGNQYQYWFVEEINVVQRDIDSLKVTIQEQEEKINNFTEMLQENIKEPVCLETISNYDINSLLKPHCTDIHLSDKTYGLTSVAQAKKFSINTKVEVNKWIREQHDCDEFSFSLMGYWNVGLKQFAFGIAWSSKHAFNIMIDNDHQIWIVEPQTNKFTRIEEMKDVEKYYPLKIILI